MPPTSAVTRRANKATADDIAVSIPPTPIVCDKNFSLSVKATCDLCEDERDRIWQMLEENMHELYRSSSFGWKPQEKRAEIFHALSRFLIVRDLPDPTNTLESPSVIAYSIFRFEREYRQNVVYCYELQVAKDFRRFGIGRLLIQMLSDIGAEWDMTKTMLTVFKANHVATLFYKSMGFIIDETSPDFSDDLGGGAEDGHDYSILSRCIP